LAGKFGKINLVERENHGREAAVAGGLATKTSTGMVWIFQRRFEELQCLDRTAWRMEVIGHEELFLDLPDHLPKEIKIKSEQRFNEAVT
jgi:hypothetical protein